MRSLMSLPFALPILMGVGCSDSAPRTDALPIWTLEEVFRKDGASDPEVPLNRVLSILPGAHGEILVTQWMAPEVLVLDSTGAFLRTIGRAGSGPGEFVSPTGLGWLGDTLWVGDARGARIQLFDEQWETAGTIQFIISPDSDDRYARGLAPSRLLLDGSVLASVPGISIGSASLGLVEKTVQVRATWDGEVLDTVAVIDIPARDFLSLQVSGNRMIATVHPVQTMSTLMSAGPLPGFYIVDRPIPTHPDSALIGIHRIDVHGDTLWSLQHALPSVPVSEEFKEHWYDLMTRPGEDATPGSERLERTLREDVEFPDYLPAVTSALAAMNGHLWIGTPHWNPDSSSWRVFDSLGTAIGQVNTGVGLSFKYTDGNVLWAIIQDEFDVPILLQFRISRDQRD